MREVVNLYKGSLAPSNVRWFWIMLVTGIAFMITGILLGNYFEEYQTASTL